MTIRADFLTVRRPGTDPATTWDVTQTWNDRTRSWEYDAVFEELPPCLSTSPTRARPTRTRSDRGELVIEGEVDGAGFQLTRPSAKFHVRHTDNEPVTVSFSPTPASYQRHGALEKRGDTWTKLATTGIADPTDVHRASTTPACNMGSEVTAKSRVAHYWTPSPADADTMPARQELTDLICILPEDTPPSTIATLAAPYSELSHRVLKEAVLDLRNQLRAGDRCGQEVMQPDQTVWRHMPDWAASDYVSESP